MPTRTTARRVVIVTFDGVQALDVTGPHEVFVGADEALRGSTGEAGHYDVRVASLRGGVVRTESGLQIVTGALRDAETEGTGRSGGAPAGRGAAALDTLLLPGGRGVEEATRDGDLVAEIERLAAGAHRIVTVCSGAFLAAAAGLLAGRRVTTHWARADRLRRRHPGIEVDADPIYVRDGNVWSSAGVTAGIDLALALVEDDHGPEVAQTVARWLVMFLRRPGGQSQFAAPVWTDRAAPGPIRAAQEAIEADPAGDHRVDVLAARVGMSERHFTRCFTAAVGTSPAHYVARVRLEAARRVLETTSDTVETIAARCGFGTAETMRRTFARTLGVSPGRYRSRFTALPGPR